MGGLDLAGVAGAIVDWRPAFVAFVVEAALVASLATAFAASLVAALVASLAATLVTKVRTKMGVVRMVLLEVVEVLVKVHLVSMLRWQMVEH